jgi:outer membrane protein assembly factor BamB
MILIGKCPRLVHAELLALLLFGLGALPLGASDWLQWRGPTRDGKVIGASWPSNLAGLQKTWKVGLGPGYSGPIIAGDRVFVTETRDKKEEIVRALERRTGAQLWQQSWEGTLSVPFFAKSNGDWIRATPACDGTNLFVAGMRDVLVCLDVVTGSNRWRLDFVKLLGAPVPDFGFVSSPLLDGDSVYVQAGASVLRIRKENGEVVWRAMKDGGGMWGSAFSSPVIATLLGRRQLVVQTREKLAGLDLEKGRLLWSKPVEAFRGMNILTPVIVGSNSVLTSTYGGKTILHRLVDGAGGVQVEESWVHKAQGYMSTPVVIGDFAYCHLKSQRVMCLELASGAERWTSDQSFGKYWSMVASGNRILALDQKGKLYLLEASSQSFQLLASASVSEQESWAHLAVAGTQLFVRDLANITAFSW